MGLSNDLISQFVKATKDDSKTKNEVTTYGEITVNENEDGTKNVLVTLDGSDTPVSLSPNQLMVSVVNKDRVSVSIKNHTLCVTGNVTTHSASANSVDNANDRITAFDIILADKVSTEELAVERARIDALEAGNLDVSGQLTANEAIIASLQAKDAEITERLTAAEADISSLSVDKLDVNTASATYATIERLEAAEADIYNLEAVHGSFVNLTTENFSAVNASIDDLEANKLDAADADIIKADIADLDAEVANLDTLIFGSATGDTIQTSFSNAVIAQLGDAQIKSAMIESISADKITAGDIITNNVRVKSEDGSLLISDETMLINDDTRVRVQIGKDASGDYSINIWDADGNLMFSKGGITDSAIKDAIIRNDMVSDTANIAAHKLDIDSLFEEINGSTNTIKSTQIYIDDEGQTLDVAFKILSEEVTDLGSTVSSQGTQITTIQGQISSKIWQQDIDTSVSDVEGQVTTLSTQYTTLEQEVDSISTTVASHTSEISTKADSSTVTEVSDKVSSLEQDLEGFQTTVSDTYATKTEVDDLIIEGRNLIIRSQSDSGYWYDTTGALTQTNNQGTAAMLTFIPIEPNTEYTFSREAGGGDYFRFNYYDADQNYIDRKAITEIDQGLAGSYTWTSPSNAYYLKVSYPEAIESRAKLERGDEATAYTVAPEDIIDVEDRVSTAETKIIQNESSITSLASRTTTVENEFDNYSTTEQMNSAIQQKADSITSSVASTYATQSALAITDEKIDNLSIGGTNLLRNSNFSNGSAYWNLVNATASVVSDSTFDQCLTFYTSMAGSIEYRVFANTNDNFTHKSNTEYTLSFWAKASESTSIQTNVAGAQNVTNHGLTTSWQKFVKTYTTTSTGSLTFWPNVADVTIYLTNVKLELGNAATDWSPSPKDIETRMTSAETKITQNSDNITSIASRTSVNETAISTLEQTADGLTLRLDTTDANVAEAAKTATNYINASTSGLVVGDMTADTLGQNVRISSSTVDIREGTTTLASFGASTIYLGKNSETAVINLCSGSATMKSVDDTNFQIYTDKRLVMKAYDSLLLDCWRDLTHQTRISMQSADPDATYMWGGISAWIYQDTVENTFDMSNNTTQFKITDGTNEAIVSMDETKFKVQASNAQINCTNGLYVGYDGDYAAKITLGYEYIQDKAVRWYWSDNALHDAFSNANGQITYVGPGDIGETTTTMIRGQYVRLYAHSGGAVYLGYSGSTAVTSDRNMKTDILDIDDKYMDFFDRLRPITYKYDCPGNKGHRDHVGFIAQEVEEALIASGLTTEEFAGIIIENDVTLSPSYDSSMSEEEKLVNETHYDTLYSLRYEEFISLLVKKVQSLQEQINQLRAV